MPCVADSLAFIPNILLINAAALLGLLVVLCSGLPWLLLLQLLLLLLLQSLRIVSYHVQHVREMGAGKR